MQLTQYSIFKPHHNLLVHAFTTRHGGVSDVPYSTLNVGFHVGDSHHDVAKNHATINSSLGILNAKVVYMKQVHSDKVVMIDQNFDFSKTPECDALITQERDVALMVMVADCNPIIMYDPIIKTIAAVHAGRQGMFKRIVSKTLKKMVSMGSEAKNIKVAVGPSIRSCCYEVQRDVVDEADKLKTTNLIVKNGDKTFLDLTLLLKKELKELDINEKNIEISTACTACSTDEYYSYRKEGITGRFAALIMNR